MGGIEWIGSGIATRWPQSSIGTTHLLAHQGRVSRHQREGAASF